MKAIYLLSREYGIPFMKKLTTYSGNNVDKAISMITRPQGLLFERKLLEDFKSMGFDLVPDRDNKSVFDPDGLWYSFNKYSEPRKFNPDRKSLRKAIDLAFWVFGHNEDFPKLEPLSFDELRVDDNLDLTKSSGLPHLGKKGDWFDRDVHRAKRYWLENRRPEPCMSYHRVQHGEKGPKTRLVWGYPASVTYCEGLFCIPLIKYFSGRHTPYIGGRTKGEIFCRLVPIINRDIRYTIDFSSFDASLNPEIIEAAFSILLTHFNLDDQHLRLWKKLIDYFINTTILMPDGYVYQKSRGIPSGSFFTQLIGSIANFIIIQYASYSRLLGPIHYRDILVMGDDSVFGLDNIVLNIHNISRACGELGMVVHPDKCKISSFGSELWFLSHEWSTGVPTRSEEDVVKRLVFPERYNSERYEIRIEQKWFSFMMDCACTFKLFRRWLSYTNSTLPGLRSGLPTINRLTQVNPRSGWMVHLTGNRPIPMASDWLLTYVRALMN